MRRKLNAGAPEMMPATSVHFLFPAATEGNLIASMLHTEAQPPAIRLPISSSAAGIAAGSRHLSVPSGLSFRCSRVIYR